MNLLDWILGWKKPPPRPYEPPHQGELPSAITLRSGGKAPILTVSPELAWRDWQRRRSHVGRTGMWPLILGPDLHSDMAGLAEDDDESVASLRKKAEQFNIDHWYRDQIEFTENDRLEDVEFDFETSSLKKGADREPDFILTDRLAGAIYLCEIPCKNSWEVPLHRSFGGFNECPVDEVHSALFKEWHQRHGAEVVGMSCDTVELYVPRPVHEPSDAKRLAQQMYAYCPDNVEQGFGTVGALAQELLGAHSWSFFWE